MAQESKTSDVGAKPLDLCESRRVFGDKLKDLRRTQSAALAEISEKTRISIEFLQALEDGDFDRLPGRLFGKGFVNALCKQYGAENDDLLIEFEQLWKDDGIRNSISEATKKRLAGKPSTNIVKTRSVTSNRLLAVLFLLFAVVAGSGALLFGFTKGKVHLSRLIKKIERAHDPKKEARIEKISGQTTEQPTTATGAQLLVLTIIEPVKIKTEVDGGKATVKDYPVGTFRLGFKDSMDLLVYDAAAVSVNFNGQQIGTLGAKGKVRRIGFRANSPDQASF